MGEERDRKGREKMEQREGFKDTLIRTRSEYIRKKNEIAMNMAKERYDINNLMHHQSKRNEYLSLLKLEQASTRRSEHLASLKQRLHSVNTSHMNRSQSCLARKEQEYEEIRERLKESERERERKRVCGISKSIENDPSVFVWMQKGASGSRLKSTTIGKKLMLEKEVSSTLPSRTRIKQ